MNNLPTLQPKNFEELVRFADFAARTSMVPEDYRGKPQNIILACIWGNELGLGATQSLAGIAVINGRACVWGDALIGIVRASPVCEHIIESVSDTEAVCTVKRKGEPEQSRTFSVKDAQKAGLWAKAGPWTKYPNRMLQMRARAFALRDVFADVLRGFSVAEEAQDFDDQEDITPTHETAPAITAPAAIEYYPADQFESHFESWVSAIAAGKRTAEQVIALVSTKGELSEEQKNRILSAA